MEDFKYLGTTVTNQNSIQEEIKSRLQSGNACYHALKILVSSSFLPKYRKIKIYKHIILSLVLYGCEIWSLTLREEHRLRMVLSRLPRRIFELKSDEVTWEWRRLHNEELSDLYSSPNITRVIKSRGMGGAGRVTRMRERCIQNLVGESEGKRPLGRPGLDGKII